MKHFAAVSVDHRVGPMRSASRTSRANTAENRAAWRAYACAAIAAGMSRSEAEDVANELTAAELEAFRVPE